MKILKRTQQGAVARRRATEFDNDDRSPSLLKDRLAEQGKRVRQSAPFRNKLINASLKQLGVTRQALEKRSDADFARAKLESQARLLKLRKMQAAQRKGRVPLRAQIEAAVARFEPIETLR